MELRKLICLKKFLYDREREHVFVQLSYIQLLGEEDDEEGEEEAEVEQEEEDYGPTVHRKRMCQKYC